MLSRELMSFIEGGVAIMAATRNENFLSRGTRAYGIYPNESGTEVTIYLNLISFKSHERNLLGNREMALAIARPSDYRAIQIKGKYLSHRHVDQRDKIIIERYIDLFASEVEKIGTGRPKFENFPYFPAIAVTMSVEVVFNQTPGKGTGGALNETL